MESVYFGKENSDLHKITTEPKPQENAPKGPREYYFPNENNKKLDIIAFISSLLASALLDGVVFAVVYPAIILTLRNNYPIFKFVKVNEYFLADIFLIYCFLFLIIYFAIRNIGRKKVYVNDNGTFYFLKMKVRVKTQRSNKSIHAKYGRYIYKINKQIEKDGLKIYKVLTGCKESDNIHDDGIFFSGFNEKKVQDEEFKIPAGYIKYDPYANYHKNKIVYPLLFWAIKLSFYGLVMWNLLTTANARLNIFNENFDLYRAEKIALLEPLGFEYYTGTSYYDYTYECLQFKVASDDDSDLRIYFDVSDDGNIVDTDYNYFFDMYCDYDTELIRTSLEALYGDDIPNIDMIDKTIEEYLEDYGNEKKYNYFDDDIYFTVSVYDNYSSDFRVYVYFSKMDSPFHWF